MGRHAGLVVDLISGSTQLFQSELKFFFGGQRDGARLATFQADFAPGETAKWMRHDRLARFGVPLKNVMRAEVEALEILAAEIGVNGRKPRELLTKIGRKGHFSDFHLHE
jgi:hypothetical protein